VERAHSHYHHSVTKGYEPLSFEEAIDREEERLAGEVEQMVADPGYFSFPHQRWSYLRRGNYIAQLVAWSRVFPREQILVLQLSELSQRPALTWSRIFGFLGIEPFDFGEGTRLSNARYDPLNPATRQRLAGWFRPHNLKLYDWLGEDLEWDFQLDDRSRMPSGVLSLRRRSKGPAWSSNGSQRLATFHL
jgi:hypothetical protein